MEKKPAGGDVLLRRWKPSIIESLSGDPDFVLQHADSRSILSQSQYKRIKALTDPTEKARDLLDYVIQRGSGPADKLLQLLKETPLQETYPRLAFLNEPLQPDQQAAEHNKSKRKRSNVPENRVPKRRRHKAETQLVTEKQLMLLAGSIGHSWKQIGRLTLQIPTAKLEQLEEENPFNHPERVFAMLRTWRMREGRGATAARLYSLLSKGDPVLLPEDLDVLLKLG